MIIFTISPDFNVLFNGTPFPFTIAEAQLFPIEVWSSYAKSKGVEPSGKVIGSPYGVKTTISFS